MATNEEKLTLPVGREGRSLSSTHDGRRGRSRSPSAYLRKKGKGIKGFLFRSSSQMKASKRSSQSFTSSQQNSASTPSPVKSGTVTTVEQTLVPDSPSNVEGEAGFPKLMPADADAKDSPQTSYDEDETSTVYNVVMDDFSLASAASSRKVEVSNMESKLEAGVPSPEAEVKTAEAESRAPPKPSGESSTETGTKSKKQLTAENVQVILLLMAISSRRFELLQLEFDPNKANVGDVLAQVSAAATEDELRSQKYIGICSTDGTELPSELLLNNVVHSENEVMIALPEGATAFSCTKLAAPILNDPKVRSLLGNSPLLETSANQKKKLFTAMKPVVEGPSPQNFGKETIESGNQISSQAAKDTSENRNKFLDAIPTSVAGTKDSSSPTPIVQNVKKQTLATKKVTTNSYAMAQDEQTKSEEVLRLRDKKLVEILSGPVDPAHQNLSSYRGASTAKVILILLLTVSVVPLVFLQLTITSPLGPGDRLVPGQFRRKCGITSITKESYNGCNELSAEFDEDGVLTVYNLGSMLSDQKNILYRLMPSDKRSKNGGSLRVGPNGSLSIGGKPVVVEVPSKLDPILHPWPFAMEVNLQKPKRKGPNTTWLVTPS